ncbi:hypothetical protein MAM1_0108c05487 [Mucor ambiguus]|uniref:Large ribosomal subunit protein eL24-related N-terminal domain-containing protein n=1 Tax=Mucor ambiguus TaxID=91626 RepID=A0A0C9M7D9_9FUNG|nr:hypothetical protein MAM1_0108c05487 [Mucor ambiguus]
MCRAQVGWTGPGRLEICSFSGHKIYPAKGKTYVRVDSRVSTFRFINGKAASYFLQRLNPRKIRWTVIYRRLNKKGMTEEVQKKRSRRTGSQAKVSKQQAKGFAPKAAATSR